MANLGKEERTIEVLPIEEPATPRTEPAPVPQPVEPAREPVPV